MATKKPTADEIATIASELAEICRAGDLDTLLCFLDMATLQAHVGNGWDGRHLAYPTGNDSAPQPEEQEPAATGVILAFQRGEAPRDFRRAPLSSAPAGL